MGGLGLMARRRAIQANPLPEEIATFSRIRGDGSAYIKTDYFPCSYDNIEIAFDLLSSDLTGSLMILMGSRLNVSGNQLFMGVQAHNSNYLSRFYNNNTPTVTLLANKKNVVNIYLNIEKGREYVNVVDSTTHDIGATFVKNEYTLPYPLHIFASNELGKETIDARKWRGNIYYIKITDARTGEVKRNYIPALSKGVAGMWEEVEGKFFGNASTTGAFTLLND